MKLISTQKRRYVIVALKQCSCICYIYVSLVSSGQFAKVTSHLSLCRPMEAIATAFASHSLGMMKTCCVCVCVWKSEAVHDSVCSAACCLSVAARGRIILCHKKETVLAFYDKYHFLSTNLHPIINKHIFSFQPGWPPLWSHTHDICWGEIHLLCTALEPVFSSTCRFSSKGSRATPPVESKAVLQGGAVI